MSRANEARVRAALESDLESYLPAVRALLSRMGFCGADLDDACSLACLRAWEKAGRCEGEVDRWLCGVARNIGREVIKKRARWSWLREKLERFGLLGEAAQPPLQVESVERRERAEVAAMLLSDLPDEQREAYELRHRDDLTLREIGERTGAPLATVNSRVTSAQRSIDRARRELEGEDER